MYYNKLPFPMHCMKLMGIMLNEQNLSHLDVDYSDILPADSSCSISFLVPF